MNIEITQLAPIPVLMLCHQGPYDQIGPVFEQICGFAESQGLPTKRIIGIYWDNPDEVPIDKLRSAACIEVPIGYQFTNSGGLNITHEQIAGGNYAITTFKGPYEQLGEVWTQFTAEIEGRMNQQISMKNPAFEVYVNDASVTPPQDLITELYMPLL